MPPFGHSTHLRVFIDPGLLQCDPDREQSCGLLQGYDVFGIEPHELVEASGGAVTELKRARQTLGYSLEMAEKKAVGPVAYFPSIEKKYGKPISHWKSMLKKMKSARHSEMVAMLKADHGMGHGHANAIVAHFRAEEGL